MRALSTRNSRRTSWALGGSGPGGRSTGSDLADFFAAEHDATFSWDDLAWLRSLSPMPLVLKGVMSFEDARLAADAGVDGIIVSNHGGRQLDGFPAAIDALPEVVEAVAHGTGSGAPRPGSRGPRGSFAAHG